MVNSCCAYKCKTRHVKGGSISFHVFPSDGLLRKKWAIATKRENFVPTKRKTLVKNAVPSIFDFPQRLQRKVCTTNTRRLNKDEINVQDTAKRMRFSSTSETSVKRAKLEESSTSSLMYGQLPIVTETISVNQTAYKKTSPVVKRMENLKCRLCLDDLQENESVTLEEFGLNMLKTLLPQVDLRISTEPKICDKCIKLLVVCYEFKTMILENNVKEEKVFTLEKDEQLCRLCGKEIFEECENLTEWKEMADKCVPELDIFSSKNVTSCKKCMDNLTNLNMFLDKVIAVQANIKTDFVVKREPVNLDNLFAFLNSPNNEHKNIKPKEELKR
ncbi:hypothetical protein NQ317_008241 [Molorchus minor]|uniref:THAP-type domain-containing protein n=1 Tax=Molorchus minor TaxID=1323400 RepID=A0ABQ9IZQ9_9CUCU|nr:hypothetical protein NQ317_008241 [Molorchus minor]